ncbi:MAG: hypothetical protein NTZ38_03325, partial [Candidatus Taylorbacteria bacterium]|nr:hypothetical protein [Candidatus Taylorbacteria bacterium]
MQQNPQGGQFPKAPISSEPKKQNAGASQWIKAEAEYSQIKINKSTPIQQSFQTNRADKPSVSESVSQFVSTPAVKPSTVTKQAEKSSIPPPPLVTKPSPVSKQPVVNPVVPSTKPITKAEQPIAKPSPVQSPRVELVKAKSEKISIFKRSNLEKIAFYILSATIALVPLVFVTSPYISLDIAKTIVIAVGTLASAVCYILIFLKERQIQLPPQRFLWIGILLAISLVVSSLLSVNFNRSFFGQGFEIGTASLTLLLFVLAWIVFETVRRDSKKVSLLYGSMITAFIVLILYQGLRLIFGPSFLSFSILTSGSSTVLGKWYDLAIYAVTIMIISGSALLFLPLSRRAKISYSALGVVALLIAIGVNHRMSWVVTVVAFGIMVVTVFIHKSANGKSGIKACIAKIPWLPMILFLVAILFVWQGSNISKPIIDK